MVDAEYAVPTAYTGESAVAALDDASPDVVLLDRRLSDLSGEAVFDAIEERSVDCRVALVSAVEPALDVCELGGGAGDVSRREWPERTCGRLHRPFRPPAATRGRTVLRTARWSRAPPVALAVGDRDPRTRPWPRRRVTRGSSTFAVIDPASGAR